MQTKCFQEWVRPVNGLLVYQDAEPAAKVATKPDGGELEGVVKNLLGNWYLKEIDRAEKKSNPERRLGVLLFSAIDKLVKKHKGKVLKKSDVANKGLDMLLEKVDNPDNIRSCIASLKVRIAKIAKKEGVDVKVPVLDKKYVNKLNTAVKPYRGKHDIDGFGMSFPYFNGAKIANTDCKFTCNKLSRDEITVGGHHYKINIPNTIGVSLDTIAFSGPAESGRVHIAASLGPKKGKSDIPISVFFAALGVLGQGSPYSLGFGKHTIQFKPA